MDWLQVSNTIIAAGGVAAVFFGLRGVKTQIQAQMFSDYTKRFQEIMSDLPLNARDPSTAKALNDYSQEDRESILNVVRKYLNLCSEELYLADAKYIKGDAWSIWKNGIADMMRLPIFRDAWAQTRQEYNAYKDFQDFIDGFVT
jgi:hypothetical protein